MKERVSVAAVVPAYNEARTLPRLLDQLIQQGYDEIIVIDDDSKDGTAKVVHRYDRRVRLIKGRKTLGSGGNRNRIINNCGAEILHFIDGDMGLLSKNTPEIIRSLKWSPDLAYYGGLVRNPDGSQNPFNYGPRASILISLQSLIAFGVWLVGQKHWSLGSFLRKILHPVLRRWPNIYILQSPRQTFWTSESNMIIRNQTFKDMGGYDPQFKYSEITDFSLRLYRRGLKTYFEPSIDVIHESMDNIYHRRSQKYNAHKLFIAKYGHLAFWLPRLADYLDGRKTQKRYHR